LRYETVTLADGTFEIRRAETRELVVLDDVPLSGLGKATAAEYLYALDLADTARGVLGKGRVRRAVERALNRHSDSPVRNTADLVASVRWMLPDLVCPHDILAVWVRRIAAETDVLLHD
jgi:hypothetical protein